jgi:predicted dehydrogenase
MINAAIVGLGWWGKHIIGSLADSDKIDILLAVDVNADQVGGFARENGIALTNDLDDALADSSIDAVILATPHSFHEEQILAVAGAGKHVFCEKPLCLTKASAKRAVAACETAGLSLGIGHERRYEPALTEIERMAAAGEFGEIMHVESNFSHNKLADIPQDDWRTSKSDAPAAGMTGMGIHLTDAYVNMFGAVDTVFAQTAQRVLPWETGDVVSVSLQFKSGATGFVSAVLATPLYIGFRVFGSEAWAEARNPTHPDTVGPTSLTVCRKGGEPETHDFEWRDTVRMNFEAFADDIAGSAPYPNTNEQKIQNIAIFEAIVASAESGSPVKLD